MAETISEGITSCNIPNKVIYAANSDRSDILTEIFSAKAIIIGSSTINNGVQPAILPILQDLKGLKFKNKLYCAFGTYGWSGEAVKIIEKYFTECKNFLPITDSYRAKWRANNTELDSCRELGIKIAKAIYSSMN